MMVTMGDERTQCRLPGRMSELLDEAADERGVFRSEVTRRALRYYIGANPDGLEAFSGTSAPGIRGVDPSNTVVAGRGVDGRKRSGTPLREAEIDLETVPTVDDEDARVGSVGDGVDETDAGDVGEETVELTDDDLAGGTYDPTEEI